MQLNAHRTFINQEVSDSIELRWSRAYHMQEPRLIANLALSLVRLGCCSIEARATTLGHLHKKDNIHSWPKNLCVNSRVKN